MLCDKCGKREATVHMMQNINGQVSEINLCSECARQAESNWGFVPAMLICPKGQLVFYVVSISVL